MIRIHLFLGVDEANPAMKPSVYTRFHRIIGTL